MTDRQTDGQTHGEKQCLPNPVGGGGGGGGGGGRHNSGIHD